MIPRVRVPRCVIDANIILEAVGTGQWRVKGVIDFGDMVHTWRVNEVAVAMAYAALTTPNSSPGGDDAHGTQGASAASGSRWLVSAALALLRGVAAVAPLSAEEARLLPVLVSCRLACSYTFGMYSHSKDPGNAYLLHHAAPAGRVLAVRRARRVKLMRNQTKKGDSNGGGLGRRRG